MVTRQWEANWWKSAVGIWRLGHSAVERNGLAPVADATARVRARSGSRASTTRYSVVGALRSNPLDPKQIVAHVARGIKATEIDAYKVRLP
jgi:hypothetical protein